ncbi:MAG: GNAT family N-acetyltransferase [Oscillospiraceae bacterium]|jgi:predicted N-acetyltransferase YhbS|nr:GNAT family N-acetyltransferase [Oscillospiraceae bacterium]
MANVIIKKAEKEDLQQILELQHLAYQSEAVRHDDFSIQPLKQTLAEVEQEYGKGLFLKAIDESDKIIGSVRAYAENGTAYIGKLIVQPKMQSQGIGTKLMKTIEQEYIGMRYELFTGYKSTRTIGIYEHLGYIRFKEQKITDKLTLVFLEKCTV